MLQNSKISENYILYLYSLYFSLGVTSKKKRVYLKTLSKQVGGWSKPFQNFFNEPIFDIRWGAKPLLVMQILLIFEEYQ